MVGSFKWSSPGLSTGASTLPYIYINDLDYGIKNWILKFADDTKLFGKIQGTSDVIKLQEDLDQLLQWAEEWQIGLPDFLRQNTGDFSLTVTFVKDDICVSYYTMRRSVATGV